MKRYLIYQKCDSNIVWNFEAKSDQDALKKGTEFLLGLGLNITKIKKSFKIGEVL